MISPPAWGWPGSIRQLRHGQTDFPTRVGMARSGQKIGAARNRFPHPRGDGPFMLPPFQPSNKISPPAWGWPEEELVGDSDAEDFPTRVGMARPRRLAGRWRCRFPHPRGDGPNVVNYYCPKPEISPPAWGWPVRMERPHQRPPDFPTRVGMARCGNRGRRPARGFPHPRGDGPPLFSAPGLRSVISPPAWGWPDGGGDAV